MVTSWVRSDNYIIRPQLNNIGGRYSVFPNGQLHIRNVMPSDGHWSFWCQTRHKLSGQAVRSVTSGKLIVTEIRRHLSDILAIQIDQYCFKRRKFGLISADVCTTSKRSKYFQLLSCHFVYLNRYILPTTENIEACRDVCFEEFRQICKKRRKSGYVSSGLVFVFALTSSKSKQKPQPYLIERTNPGQVTIRNCLGLSLRRETKGQRHSLTPVKTQIKRKVINLHKLDQAQCEMSSTICMLCVVGKIKKSKASEPNATNTFCVCLRHTVPKLTPDRYTVKEMFKFDSDRKTIWPSVPKLTPDGHTIKKMIKFGSDRKHIGPFGRAS
ncbi:hypothetical protein GQR58_026639 [Nymphon striatum]|nr:hypothetical protein GQR58_026639 [Nymphon striatum]